MVLVLAAAALSHLSHCRSAPACLPAREISRRCALAHIYIYTRQHEQRRKASPANIVRFFGREDESCSGVSLSQIVVRLKLAAPAAQARRGALFAVALARGAEHRQVVGVACATTGPSTAVPAALARRGAKFAVALARGAEQVAGGGGAGDSGREGLGGVEAGEDDIILNALTRGLEHKAKGLALVRGEALLGRPEVNGGVAAQGGPVQVGVHGNWAFARHPAGARGQLVELDAL